MAQLHLTLKRRWWWSLFFRLVIIYAWCIHRFVTDEYLDGLAERAGAFGAKHGLKVGAH